MYHRFISTVLPQIGSQPARVGAGEEFSGVGFFCMPVCSVFRRIHSRRGGGGVERGGDACIALGGRTLPLARALSPTHCIPPGRPQGSTPHFPPPPPLPCYVAS